MATTVDTGLQAPAWVSLRELLSDSALVAEPVSRARPEPSVRPPAGLLTVREASRRVGVHENTLRNWVDQGLLTAVRLPRSGFRRFEPSEIERVRRGILGNLAGPGRTDGGRRLGRQVPIDIRYGDDLDT